MHLANAAGRLGLPDLSLYFQANVLMYLASWNLHTSKRLWVPLEKTMVGQNLAHVPWLPGMHRGLAYSLSLLSWTTLAI